LASSVARALTRKADEAFIAQAAPVGPATAPPAGLLNVVGVVAGGEVTGSLDGLVDLVAELESNGSEPSMIVMDPLGYSTIAKLKTNNTDSNESLVGAGAGAPTMTLLGLPVVKNRFVEPYSGVVIDKTAITSAIGPIRVDTDTSTYFAYDSVAVPSPRPGHPGTGQSTVRIQHSEGI
jgi:HK97 family phage major capsid protein